MVAELSKLNVDIRKYVDIVEFKDNAVYYKDRAEDSGELKSIQNIDTFILATGVKPNRDFSKALKKYLKSHSDQIEKKPQVKNIGDARSVGNAMDAVDSGFKYARRLKKVE